MHKEPETGAHSGIGQSLALYGKRIDGNEQVFQQSRDKPYAINYYTGNISGKKQYKKIEYIMR
jgi:hypothetical protein